jgi:hypothetical protein
MSSDVDREDDIDSVFTTVTDDDDDDDDDNDGVVLAEDAFFAFNLPPCTDVSVVAFTFMAALFALSGVLMCFVAPSFFSA